MNDWNEIREVMMASNNNDRDRAIHKTEHRIARARQFGCCIQCKSFQRDEDLFLNDFNERLYCGACTRGGELVYTSEGDPIIIELPMLSGLEVSFMRAVAPRPGERKIRPEDARWGRGIDVTDQLPEVWRSMGPWILEDDAEGGIPTPYTKAFRLTHKPSGRMAGRGSWVGILGRMVAWGRSERHIADIKKHPTIESKLYKRSPKTAQKEA